jgi:hypothetical protein
MSMLLRASLLLFAVSGLPALAQNYAVRSSAPPAVMAPGNAPPVYNPPPPVFDPPAYDSPTYSTPSYYPAGNYPTSYYRR